MASAVVESKASIRHRYFHDGWEDEASPAVEFPDAWDFILRFAKDKIKISQKTFRNFSEYA
jgi:hypothetical protein